MQMLKIEFTFEDGTSCEEDMLCGVNRPKDPRNLSDLEKKHIPVITAPDKVGKDGEFEVKVEIGKLLVHPNEPGHFITAREYPVACYGDESAINSSRNKILRGLLRSILLSG